MIDVVIRKGESENLNQIALLDKQYEFEMYSQDSLKAFLNGDTYITYIAYVNDVAVGYIVYSIAFDEGELIKIVVSKDCRGSGIGCQLLNKTLDILRNTGIGVVFLEVREDNYPAINLYEKIGFEKINIRQKYYDNKINAIIYRKCLDVKDKL